VVEIPATKSTSSAAPAASTSHLPMGYPTPEVVHSLGYMAGFFLNDSNTGVLTITSFSLRLDQTLQM
jgi:hypothetical protein